jgi:hypothetical protein
MVSNIRYPKPDLRMNIIAAILIITTLILGNNYYGIAQIILLISILIYAIIGPIYILKSR